MKEKFNKTKAFLNRDVNEFNKVILSVICITILLVAGIISYTITNSYALFSSDIDGTKTIKLHPTKEYEAYAFEDGKIAYIGTEMALSPESHTGYCLKCFNSSSNEVTFNSCEQGYGFLTQAKCTTEANRNGGSTKGYSCEAGSWESEARDYVTEPSEAGEPVFLKHSINADNQIESSEVCFYYISADTLYCLKGGGTWNSNQNEYVNSYYQDNVDILDNIFGSTNCEVAAGSGNIYQCTDNNYTAQVDPNGYVRVDYNNPQTTPYECSIGEFGDASCGTIL